MAAHTTHVTPTSAPRIRDFTGNCSSLAASGIAQTAGYATMLERALAPKNGTPSPVYARLYRRGVLDDAISYAGYAVDALKNDGNSTNDRFAEIIDASVINVLSGVRRLGPTIAEADTQAVRDELVMAIASARNVERHVDSPTQTG